MITREYLAQYTYIQQAIEANKEKINRPEKHPPLKEYDKVYGSDANFPYTIRSFKVEGYNGSNEDGWNEQIRKLEAKITADTIQLEEMKLEIENFIVGVQDLSTRLMFSYYYIDGMEQEDIAKKLHVERSTISKRISTYLEKNSNIACNI